MASRPNRSVLMALLCAIATLMGCSSMSPTDFAGTTPTLRLEEYFQGQTRAYGLFHDRFGTLRRQFTVDITGTLDEGGVLTLDERFSYSDGEREQRIWTITPTGPDSYEGRAGDVVGTARGVLAGSALNWQYDLDLKVGDGSWRVHFDDWMFLMQDGILMNRAQVSKWGFDIGTVTIVFRRLEETQAAISRHASAAE